MTRLDAYHHALKFLADADNALDQAHSCMSDARMMGIHSGGVPESQSRRLSIGQIYNAVEQLRDNLTDATCESCDQRISDCQCAWLRESI